MKNFLASQVFLVFFFLVWFSQNTVNAQNITLRVATYNIRYDEKRDTANAWLNRLPYLTDLIKFHEMDIVGTQEGLHHQLKNLERELNNYAWFGVGRDDGKEKGEFSAIFYRKDKYKVLDSGTFWFSPTPNKPSKGWDAALPRVCTWGRFQDNASGQTFYVYNLHFDHVGVEARKEASKQILARLKAMQGNTPVILMGDFNIDQHNESYTILNTSGVLRDAYELAPIKLAPKGTFNGFDVTKNSDKRIDHIFLTSQFQAKKYGILTYTYGPGKLPSDHYPVLVELSLSGKKQ